MLNIIPIPLGLSMGPVLLPFVNAYLVRSGDGWVVVDTGPPGCARRVLAALRRHGIPGKSVRLILLTHGHFDHTGSAVELQRLLPGHPRIAMHPGDRPFVTGERLPLSLRPTSLTGAFSFLGGTVGMLLWTLAATLRPWPDPVLQEVLWLDEVSASDTPVDLMPLCGLEAVAVLTPGHSPGSLTLRLPTGEAVVGDILSRGLRRTAPRRPLLVDEPDRVLPSLRRIAALRPTTVYPGHGGPFRGEDVERLVERL